MGPSLALPSGSAISPGDSVTVEGVRYVLTDGTVAVSSPDVAVNYNVSQSAQQVASALLTAIQTSPRPQPPINLIADEQNDTLSTALIGSTTGDSAIITVTGNIGDNVALSDPTADVDIVRVDLARGATVVADAAASVVGMDAYLRLFDSQGGSWLQTITALVRPTVGLPLRHLATERITSRSVALVTRLTILRSSELVLPLAPVPTN